MEVSSSATRMRFVATTISSEAKQRDGCLPEDIVPLARSERQLLLYQAQRLIERHQRAVRG